MKALIKCLISLTILLSAQISLADDATPDHSSEAPAAHDWNKVFPQPTPNLALGTIPPSSEIVAPAYMSKVPAGEVTLKWKPVPHVMYHLQVATDPNYKWLVADEKLITYTEYKLKAAKPNQQYFWRIYTQATDNKPGYTKGAAVSSEFETLQ